MEGVFRGVLSFRWFVGLGIDDPVWDASSFSKNRDRLLDGDVAMGFLAARLERAFFGRRDPDRGLGIDEELPTEGRRRRAGPTGGRRFDR
jgi:hypothetical protein